MSTLGLVEKKLADGVLYSRCPCGYSLEGPTAQVQIAVRRHMVRHSGTPRPLTFADLTGQETP